MFEKLRIFIGPHCWSLLCINASGWCNHFSVVLARLFDLDEDPILQMDWQAAGAEFERRGRTPWLHVKELAVLCKERIGYVPPLLEYTVQQGVLDEWNFVQGFGSRKSVLEGGSYPLAIILTGKHACLVAIRPALVTSSPSLPPPPSPPSPTTPRGGEVVESGRADEQSSMYIYLSLSLSPYLAILRTCVRTYARMHVCMRARARVRAHTHTHTHSGDELFNSLRYTSLSLSLSVSLGLKHLRARARMRVCTFSLSRYLTHLRAHVCAYARMHTCTCTHTHTHTHSGDELPNRYTSRSLSRCVS
jgi:hypothetical protein